VSNQEVRRRPLNIKKIFKIVKIENKNIKIKTKNKKHASK
jgi:hypothetical protein